jgi:hypothetical protein
MSVYVNNKPVAENLDIVQSAGKTREAYDVTASDVSPQNGIIEVWIKGGLVNGREVEGILQALELVPSSGKQ